jgi:anti-sigma-K factor RskA
VHGVSDPSGNEPDRSDADLADEYVLGLLDAAEAAEVEARLPADAGLAGLVGAARDRFLDLALTARPLAPPATLLQKIEEEIERRSPARVVRFPPRPAAGAATIPAAPGGRGWRITAFASLAASVLLAFALVWQIGQTQPPRAVAILLGEDGAPLAMVEALPGELARVTMLAEVALPPGKTLQLWTVPAGATAPVSLGVLGGPTTGVLQGPTLPAPVAEQFYAVSVEDAGGSPTGGPTGAILGQGAARLPR